MSELRNELAKALYEVLMSDSCYTVSSCPDCVKGFKKTECRKCRGTGMYEGQVCFVCKGSGSYIYKPTKKFTGKKCNTCNGSGRKISPPRS